MPSNGSADVIERRRKNAYFQFPLCSLRILANAPHVGLLYIVNYCCVEDGKRRWSRMSKEEQMEWNQRLQIRYEPDLKAAIGGWHLGVKNVTRSEIAHVRQQHHHLELFVMDFQKGHGRDALVRIRSDIMLDSSAGKLPLMDFCTLCGIYSKLGDKRFTRITRLEIYTRVHGCRSSAIFKSEGPIDSAWTFYRVIAAIDRLRQRDFFARVTFGKRQTFYSHRLDPKVLRSDIIELKTKHAKKIQEQRILDAEMTKEIRRLRTQSDSTSTSL
jgi:hypothetical protein